MPIVEGIVKKISTREGEGQYGPYKLYNVCIESNGQETWYGFGNKNPGVRELSNVRFLAQQNNKGYWTGDAKSLELVDAPVPQQAAQGPQSAPAPAQRAQSPNDRQSSITLQTAFKVSAEYVGRLVEAGVIKPAMNSQAKKEAAQDMIWDMVKRYSAELHEYFNDPDGFKESVLSSIKEAAVDESGSDESMFE